MKKLNNKKGFTIVELVIVIAVIGILAAVLIPTFSGIVENANKTSAMEEAKNAYTDYLSDIEHAKNIGSHNFCIKVDDYYFLVTNGQFSDVAVECTKSSTDSTITYKAMEVSGGKLVDGTNHTHTTTPPSEG